MTSVSFAPSGNYVASGDAAGNVKVWDTLGSDHTVKLETRSLAGKINDVAWDGESKRLIAVGDGKDKFGHAFLVDTGSSVGEITGHGKSINSVSIRPVRPIRAVTASDDFSINFYHGVPFKFQKSINDHTRFVYDVRYSPDGSHFVSVGADGKIFLYQGEDGTKVAELSSSADSHKGTVFSISWSADSKQIVTSGADGTVKLWDVAKQNVVSTWTIGSSVDDQQVGNVWIGKHIISLSVSGDLNYLEQGKTEPTRIIKGHQKGITAMAKAEKLYTGSYDGKIFAWNVDNGQATALTGNGHGNQVNAMASSGKEIVSAGLDDSIRFIDAGKNAYVSSITTTSVPLGVAVNDKTCIAVTAKEALVLQDSALATTLALSFPATAIALHKDTVAIGSEDTKVRLYKLDGTILTDLNKVMESNRGGITALAFSPDGTLLAVADKQRAINVYDVASASIKLNQWVFHSARVNSIAFSPDGKHAVSGSLDTNVYVWSVEKPMRKVAIKSTHPLHCRLNEKKMLTWIQ